MDYNKLFHTAFSQLSPMGDENAALQSIIERKVSMKQHKSAKKTAIIIIAAAAVMITAGVTVSAANGWNIGEIFSGIFGARQQQSGQENTPDAEFERMGMPLDITLDGENYSINVNGIIAGNTTAYVTYDVTLDGAYAPAEGDSWFCNVNAELSGGAEVNMCESGIAAHNDSTLSCYTQVNFEGIEDMQGETLTITFGKLDCMRADGSFTTVKLGDAVEIPIDFAPYNETRSIEIGKDITIGASSITITSAEISGFTVKYYYDEADVPYDNMDDYIAFVKALDGSKLTLSDGTRAGTKSGGSGDGCFEAHLIAPVDVNNVTAITIGDLEITVS